MALVYSCLWAMRFGLLSRFWGSLGMALGVAALLLLVQFCLIFFIYFGLLLVGKLPGGRPPAWAAGEAVPWPTPGERMAKEIETEERPARARRRRAGPGDGRAPTGPDPKPPGSLEAPDPDEAPEPGGDGSSPGGSGPRAQEAHSGVAVSDLGVERRALPVRADLAHHPLEARLGRVVDELHRRGDAGMDGGDLLVHRLGDGAVGRMALAAGAQLDQVHRLARVQVEDVADAEGEAERVGGELLEPGGGEPLVLVAGDFQGPLEFAADARFAHLLGDARAEVGAEPLPLHGQQAVALQVAEGAVVGDDLEAVAERLEAAAGAVAAVVALADDGGEHLAALVRAEPVDPGADLRLRRPRRPRRARR